MVLKTVKMKVVPDNFPPWMRGFLFAAGVYNLAWGIFITIFPDAYFSWLTEVNGQAIWLISYQGAGVIIFGIFYIWAGLYPVRMWFLIFTGLLSKLFGAVGVYFFILDKSLTNHFIFHLLVNDLAWVVPLAIITLRALRLRKTLTYEKAA